MKKSDLAMLGMIVVVSLAVAFFIGQNILGKTKLNSVKVKTIDTISSEITAPDPAIFGENAINPAVPIDIGNTNNQQPFGANQQQ